MYETVDMMAGHARPRLLVSECLEFKPVRWNGQMMRSTAVQQLKPHVDFIPTCPEVGIGLGIPRETVQLVDDGTGLRLIQPATGRDCTGEMVAFARELVAGLPPVDGAILKSGSPSSALRDAKFFPAVDGQAPTGHGPGLFTREVLSLLPGITCEDEGRLENPTIRDWFYRVIFTRARFRGVKASGTFKDLVNFHAASKFLLKGFDQQRAGVLGRIVATARQHALDETFARYEVVLHELLTRHPACGSNVNVFLHLLGFFSDDVSRDEKAFYLDLLDKYRRGAASLGTMAALARSWVVRFDKTYLRDQSFLAPYPEPLQDLDVQGQACETKEYWAGR